MHAWRFNNRAAWERFVSQHTIDPQVPPLIAQSWKRCWPKLDHSQQISLSRLSDRHFLSVQVANFDLVSIARPFMEDIYQFIQGSSLAVALVNRAGYILDLLGDRDMLAALQEHGISAGVILSEAQMGTNAFASALFERVPIQVTGCQHYCQQFHPLADAAAPIFDLSGRPLGAIGIFTRAQNAHEHSLGMVVAGARAIQAQRQADQLLGEHNTKMAELNAILGSISEGILVWNWEGVLMHANLAATQILGLSPHSLVGHQLHEFIQLPSFLQEAVEKQKILTDVEATLGVDGQLINCILSLHFVRGSKGIQGVVAILRGVQDVRKLVQKQLGAHFSTTLDDLAGSSAQIQRVRGTAMSAARTRAPVLLRGESGTGKSTLARAIHNHGQRRDGGFIVFACASIPGDILLTELSGYAEGLSPKQPGGHPSKFELAEGGSLFFQDVEALPLEAQAILLNVLELGIVQRLGSKRAIEVDVHVIASTTEDLEKRVAEGSFRGDLYYRLSPYEIWLPPLRQRMGDIPQLVERILMRLSRQHHRALELAPEAMELLQNYSWPGNIREMEGVLERAMIQAGSSHLIADLHLPNFIRHPEAHASRHTPIESVLSLEEIEREAIIQAARMCHGNVTRMAQVLGLGRTTVWRRLQNMDISLEDLRNSKEV